MVAVAKNNSPELSMTAGLGSSDCSVSDSLITAIEVYDNVETIRDHWAQLEERSHITIYQSYRWAEQCLKTIDNRENCRPFIVGGWQGDKLRFILPMVLLNNKISRLQWIGCSHANIGMGLFDPQFAAAASEEIIVEIFNSLGKKMPGLCIAHLHNQPAVWDSMPNPLMKYPHQVSVNNAHYLDLSAGFEALLATGNIKRKRKKFRQQCRLAQLYGGYHFRVADTKVEAEQLLEVFSSQKAGWFERRGVENVFSSSAAQNFLTRLADGHDNSKDRSFYVFALEIGGKIRAVFGAGKHSNHLSGYFSSISYDELSHISPGEMLMYLMLQYCCETGIQSVDLGSGDERYKRSWCTSVLTLHDHLIPLSTPAKPLAACIGLTQFAKRIIRTSPFLWSLVRTARRHLARRFRDHRTR